MRYLIVLGLLLALFPKTAHAQFAGCAGEADLAAGARYKLEELNGLTVTLTAIGIGDFDPAITVYDASGAVTICNDNSRDAQEVVLSLPTADAAEANPNNAMVKFNVPGDQGRLDYEVVVTSADGQAGEFVLIYEGAEVFGASDIDTFKIVTSAGQVAAQVPIGVYVANLWRPEKAYDPAVTFTYGENLEQFCGKSSSRSLCDGDSEDLTGYSVQLADQDAATLNGDDVMLFFQAGGTPAEFQVDVKSYQGNSYGPYALLIHSGVGELE